MVVFAKELISTKSRKYYGMRSIIERVRWDWMVGKIQTADGYRINNDYNASYSRYLQMTEPELYGFFQCRKSYADTELIVNGENWRQFMARKEGEAYRRNPTHAELDREFAELDEWVKEFGEAEESIQ
jgi:hypothetical protein